MLLLPTIQAHVDSRQSIIFPRGETFGAAVSRDRQRSHLQPLSLPLPPLSPSLSLSLSSSVR